MPEVKAAPLDKLVLRSIWCTPGFVNNTVYSPGPRLQVVLVTFGCDARTVVAVESATSERRDRTNVPSGKGVAKVILTSDFIGTFASSVADTPSVARTMSAPSLDKGAVRTATGVCPQVQIVCTSVALKERIYTSVGTR